MLIFNSIREIKEYLEDIESEALFCDGYDDAILGLAETFGGLVIVYDRSKIIDKLIQDGMTLEEAEEYFSFNISGSGGDNMPIYMMARGEFYENPIIEK
jgi:hypothetical protein